MSTGAKDRLHSAAYKRIRAQVIASTTHCYLCRGARGPLDRSIRWPHPLSIEVDHVKPRSMGGSVYDPANMRPVHAVCHREKNAGAGPSSLDPVTTRQW